MAGHVVALYLKENNFDVTTLSARRPLDGKTHLIDVTNLTEFKSFLQMAKCDVVVNCIGLLVKQSEVRKDLAVYINSYLPHLLEHYYKNYKTRVIHISTDGVFSSKNPPYKEDTPVDAQDFYGRSKALGELNNDKDLTFRLSIVGPDMRKDGSGLFNWFWQQRGEISGYDRIIWSGIMTSTLARAIKAAIEQNLSGVYHLVPKKSISKFELLQLFKEVFDRKNLKIKPNSEVVLDKTLTNSRRDFDFVVPDHKTMAKEMKKWIESHKNLYPHYN